MDYTIGHNLGCILFTLPGTPRKPMMNTPLRAAQLGWQKNPRAPFPPSPPSSTKKLKGNQVGEDQWKQIAMSVKAVINVSSDYNTFA